MRKPEAGLDKMLFQIHPSNEFAKLMLENNLEEHLAPIELKANHEYFIEITPIGQITSKEYKALDFQQRKCYTEDEFSESSMFKSYTVNNCKYECGIKTAKQKCKCLPWDFINDEG